MFITAEVLGSARTFDDEDRLLKLFVDYFEDDLRKQSQAAWKAKKADESKLRTTDPWGIGQLTMPMAAASLPTANNVHASSVRVNTRRARSASAVDRRTDRREGRRPYRGSLLGRWPSCMDYLASSAWLGLKFRLQNEEKGFLTNVEVVLTFHGCRGIDFFPAEYFEWEKVENPTSSSLSRAQQLAMMGIAASPTAPAEGLPRRLRPRRGRPPPSNDHPARTSTTQALG